MLGAAVRVSSQRLVGCGAVGPPSHSLPPPSLPREVARTPPSHCTVRGGCEPGGPAPPGGPPRGTVPLPLSCARRLGRQGVAVSCVAACVGVGAVAVRVPPVVAPLGEGVAQGPGEPVVGVRIRDAEHRPPLQEGRPRRLSVGPRRPNHRPDDPLVVLWGRPPPWAYLPVPPVPPEEHGIQGPVPHPPGGPRAGPAQTPVKLHVGFY